MSLHSVLQEAFLSYLAKVPSDIQQCLSVQSLWKKPSMYWMTVYYCKSTNQIICYGQIIPHSSDEYEVFHIFEHADAITVGELLIDIVGLLNDETDIVKDGEDDRCEFLHKRLIDLNEDKIAINN